MRIALLLLSLTFLNSCYLANQGWHLLSDQRQAVSITTLLADPELDTVVRKFLESIQSIRKSAEELLGLQKNKNYIKYIDTNRDYAVIAVSASKKTSFEPYLWGYPIFGKLPYRGYYRKKDAQKEALRLEQKQYDVLIRPVSSFSSLDYFSAPVYSFMAKRTTASLAELIFHELAHSRLWLKKHTQFNEEFATFTGLVGSLYYMEQKYGRDSEEYIEAVNAQKDFQTMYDLMQELRRNLADIYDKQLEQEDTLIQKQRIIRQFRIYFNEHYDERFLTSAYRNLTEYTINNAYLNLFDTYTGNIHLFYKVYEHFKENLSETIDFIAGAEKIFSKKDSKNQDEGISETQFENPYDYLQSILINN